MAKNIQVICPKLFHNVRLVRSGVWRGMAWSGRQSVGELDWITGCACLTHRRSIIPMPTLYAHICHLLCHAHPTLTIYANIYPLHIPMSDAMHIKCPLYMPISAIYYAMHIPCPLYLPIYTHFIYLCLPSTIPCTSIYICPYMPIYCAHYVCLLCQYMPILCAVQYVCPYMSMFMCT